MKTAVIVIALLSAAAGAAAPGDFNLKAEVTRSGAYV